jgi:hypothetical protein
MAQWDSADLLARAKLHAKRPATDAGTTDANWYTLLGDAQLAEYKNISVHAPGVLFGAPTALTSSDSGVTYYFADDADGDPIVPMGPIELYDNLSRPPLRPGTFWSDAADYVLEGDHIRMPGNKARTFGSGFPQARYITPPTVISASTAPTLKPKAARELIVFRACVLWAQRGGRRDPRPYQDDWNKAWFGDPATGQMGWIYVLKGLDPFAGVEAHEGRQFNTLLGNVDTGAGYTRLGG